MKNIIKTFILLGLLGLYIISIVFTGDYKILEILMFCIDIASFIIIAILSVTTMIIGMKFKNKFLIEDSSIVISFIYDIVYLFMIIFQYINGNIEITSFSVLLIPLVNGLFISILISYIMKGKNYE